MRISAAKLFSNSRYSLIPPFRPSFKGHRRGYSYISMPDWYLVTEDALQTIQPCKNAIVRLPSENFKVVDLKPNSSISLGKFGTFNANQLFGKPYGPSWEILPNKDIKLLEREVQEEDDDVYVRDNRDVFDEGTAQLLTPQEIQQARATMSSKDIISTISANNVNFDKKSVFSQEKYVRSKEQRFLRAFTPVQPTAGNICEFLWAEKRDRCMDLSIESIGLMLSLANVCAGGRYLLIDETGLLVAAILERGASVFLLHGNQEANLDTLKFFPHLQRFFRSDPVELSDQTFHSMDFLSAFDPSTINITPPHQGQDIEIYERKLRTYNRELQVHKLWAEGHFDGFISVSSYDPATFLPRCLNKLELCSGIALYSPFREVVTELQNFIQTKMPTRPLIAPIIHELRAPRWSTLKGRARPDMIGRGGGGWILSGTRVEESEPEIQIWSSRRNKKRKINENGSEMEDVKTDTSAIETD